MKIERTLLAIPTMSDEASAGVWANVERLLATGTTAQKAAAVQVQEALEARQSSQAAAKAAHVAALPPVQRIVEAFQERPLKEPERKIVQVLLDNPGASSPELTRKTGWSGRTAWHVRFGRLCKARQERLWPEAEDGAEAGDDAVGVLVEKPSGTEGFTFRPEAVEAFATLGLRPTEAPAAGAAEPAGA